MPRHRKECIPKHRAQPQDDNSGRHVPLSAATEAAGQAAQVDETQTDWAQAETVQFEAVRPDAAHPAEAAHSGADHPADTAYPAEVAHPGADHPAGTEHPEADAPASASSPRRRARPSGSRSAGSRPARSRRPATDGRASSNQQRRMRGLLVTPWFAAGAGFVIAAALALNSPHTVLTYRPNTSKCSTCTAPGSLATAKPGEVFKPPKPVRPAKVNRKSEGAARRGAVAATGSAVGFQVVSNRDGEFTAVVTVPAQQESRGWRLRFELPGRRIVQVIGARWHPGPGGHGGVASMLTFQQGWSRHSEPPTTPGDGLPKVSGVPGSLGHWVPQQFRFLVTAQGGPVTPVGCVLNGVGCHWGQLPPEGSWHGG